MWIDPLIAVRAIHIAVTALVAGIVFFEWLVAGPALREAGEPRSAIVVLFRARIACILWVGLAVAVVSGAAWLLVLAANILDRPIMEVIADGTAWTVLTQTRFGIDWQLRFLLAALLGGLVKGSRRSGGHSLLRGVPAAALAAAFVGALAWAGHGGATPGTPGIVHLSADILHLIAAAAWFGGLVPFAMLLGFLRRSVGRERSTIARLISRRFSNLGLFAVGSLLVSGAINASFLVGDVQGLAGTSYGRLLTLKILLFAVMVCLAAVNRQYLLPQLTAGGTAPDSNLGTRIARKLRHNAVLEIVLGIAVLIVVAMLGVTSPATEAHVHIH
jgi:putative copper resistance protein D